ncbi:hypothetical protein C471_14677 [Halorubrum saccharovorum DSM 1137]|uniref:Sulfatase N-terminal domain-containing protein n=1 Tax=Halorubrum saccharovorum DSM 1137 TaxID=1227484 RepID=M0DMN8_9EURY|nr:hypothetical protein [Halorubrum saccharovorum]ELZ36063.1 hypothetical protein C471_14677 [Halorubrum saccharovorum DSM 1137]
MPVNFRKWVSESVRRTKNDPKMGIPRSAYYAYVGALLTVTNRKSWGTNIFDCDWDLLIILDGCRVDAIQEVADEYSYINKINSIRSVGSTSFEWMPLTFQQRYRHKIQDTAYVSGNPYITPVFREKKEPPVKQSLPFGPKDYDVVDPSDFLYLDEVRKYGIDSKKNCILPRTMTDRAVDVARSRNPDRLIVHYMQPHEPHIGEEKGLGQNVFTSLREKKITKEEAWASYIENLRLVLDELEVLLENVNAEKAVITADHGEAFGEFGFYAHQIGCPLPVVRKVPWVETSAIDQETYSPTIKPNTVTNQDTLEDHLEDLGYI